MFSEWPQRRDRWWCGRLGRTGAGGIDNFEVAFNADGTVVEAGDFGCGHLLDGSIRVGSGALLRAPEAYPTASIESRVCLRRDCSLALGTGANTAIFQLLDAIRLRRCRLRLLEELAEVRIDDMTHARGNWLRDAALTNPLWERIRERQEAFSGIFAWANDTFNIAPSGEGHDVAGLWVSGDFFRVLGVAPAMGRLFTAADERRGCGLGPGAVISYGFWQRELGGDPSVIGRKIPIARERLEVIGVTPPGFFGLEIGRTFDIALPICAVTALREAIRASIPEQPGG